MRGGPAGVVCLINAGGGACAPYRERVQGPVACGGVGEEESSRAREAGLVGGYPRRGDSVQRGVRTGSPSTGCQEVGGSRGSFVRFGLDGVLAKTNATCGFGPFART